MAQLIVRNLENDVRDKLQDLAHQQGQSMEETVRGILRRAVISQNDPLPLLGTRLSNLFASHGLEEEIPELYGGDINPVRFDQ